MADLLELVAGVGVLVCAQVSSASNGKDGSERTRVQQKRLFAILEPNT